MKNILFKIYFLLFFLIPFAAPAGEAPWDNKDASKEGDSYEALQASLKGHEYTANSSMAMTYLERAKRRQKDGDYDTANADYEKAMKFDPVLASQYPELGFSLKVKDWMKRASDCMYRSEKITCYQRALEIDPKFLKAYKCLGREYYADKKYRQAAETFEKLLELNPEDKEARKILQKAIKKAGN